MKILGNIFLVIALFAVNIMDAKSMTRGASTQTTTQQPSVVREPQTQPIVQPQKPTLPSTQPIMLANSYAQALDIIRTKLRSDQVWKNNQFTDEFINFVKSSVTSDIFTKALLQAGINLHVKFTGDNAIDRTILDDINNAVDRQMELLFPKNMPKSGKFIEQPRPVQSLMHVIPTNAQTLREFDLCPLFSQPDMSNLTKEQALEKKTLQQQGYTQEEIATFFTQIAPPPRYSIFNEQHRSSNGKLNPEFEPRYVERNAPCSVQLGRYGNWHRTLMQCKTLDQFELQKHGFSVAMCATLSLNNGVLIRDYALTGNTQNLYKMHSVQDAANFLRKLGLGDWLNVEFLRKNMIKLKQELGVDGINFSAFSTVSLFDSELNKKPGFAIFSQEEFDYAQRVKATIRDGLRQDNYIHIMIIGNEETVQWALGHYFCFAIIKAGNTIQYVVLDTLPSVYHLQAGSHERDRLMFVIENIEQGYSLINVANIRIINLQALEQERQASLK